MRTSSSPGDRDAGEGQRGDQVADDHHPAGRQPVDPGAGGEPDEQPGHPGRCGERTHPARAGVEADDGQEREQDRGGGVAEDADALAEPEQAEVPVAGQWGRRGNRCGVGRHGWAGNPRAKTNTDSRSTPSSGTSRCDQRISTSTISSATCWSSSGERLQPVLGGEGRRRPTRGRTRRWRSTPGCARTGAAGPAPRRRRRP